MPPAVVVGRAAGDDGVDESVVGKVASMCERLEKNIGDILDAHQRTLAKVVADQVQQLVPGISSVACHDVDWDVEGDDSAVSESECRAAVPSPGRSPDSWGFATLPAADAVQANPTEITEEEDAAERPVATSLTGFQGHVEGHRSAVLRGAKAMWEGEGTLKRVTLCASWLKDRREFELTIALAILTNSLCIGWSTNLSIVDPMEPSPQIFRTLDLIFLSLFCAELVVRLLADGREFFNFHNKLFRWNMFDAILVGLTVLNELNPFQLNLSVVRVYRVLRLARLIRVIRLMRQFRELRMMVSGILNCGKTLLWSVLLLCIITYIYAVFSLQVMSEWLQKACVELGEGASDFDQANILETKAFIETHFPHLWWSMYTLLKAVSSGINWGEIADPMEKISPFLLPAFALYVVLSQFCVLNIITAAFVEAASRTAQEEDTSALEHLEEREAWISQIKVLFNRHDEDRGGSLDWKEFHSIMTDWRTQGYFRDIGLNFDFQHVEGLFRLFDWNGDGNIDINEFAQGVHKLRGNAQSLDMFREFQKLNKKVERVNRRIKRSESKVGCCSAGPGGRRPSKDFTASQETSPALPFPAARRPTRDTTASSMDSTEVMPFPTLRRPTRDTTASSADRGSIDVTSV